MLIGNVMMSERGIKIYDVDGSYIELDAQDALDLAAWVLNRRDALYAILRREQRKADEAGKESTSE